MKDGYVSACTTASLGEMADAFLSNPSWSDFDAIEGSSIVELTGEFMYEGLPATATLQFTITAGTFSATYLGINEIDQSQLMLVGFLNKMCSSVY